MNERSWNQVALGAIALMAAMLVYNLVAPMPKVMSKKKRQDQEFKLKLNVNDLREKVTSAKARIGKTLWTVRADELGAQAMAFVNTRAEKGGLKVSAFRPQRTQEGSGVTVYPYLVALEGPYPNIVRFIREMETPATKLAVSTVQIASADGASDAVTATVGLLAFRQSEKEKI